jgi:hypothetical protein
MPFRKGEDTGNRKRKLYITLKWTTVFERGYVACLKTKK